MWLVSGGAHAKVFLFKTALPQPDEFSVRWSKLTKTPKKKLNRKKKIAEIFCYLTVILERKEQAVFILKRKVEIFLEKSYSIP